MTNEDPARNYQEALLGEIREELQKADGKASILFATAGIAIGALLTGIIAGNWTPSKLTSSTAEALVWASILLAALGLLILGAAVRPRLRKQSLQSKADLHYFGHVAAHAGSWVLGRYGTRTPEFDQALKAASTEQNYDDRLRDQIWFLGCTAYRKYKLIASAMWIFALALGCGGFAVLFEVSK